MRLLQAWLHPCSASCSSSCSCSCSSCCRAFTINTTPHIIWLTVVACPSIYGRQAMLPPGCHTCYLKQPAIQPQLCSSKSESAMLKFKQNDKPFLKPFPAPGKHATDRITAPNSQHVCTPFTIGCIRTAIYRQIMVYWHLNQETPCKIVVSRTSRTTESLARTKAAVA